MNSTEKHETLIAEGWSTRPDGLMRPPTGWHDHRVYTPSAAWDEHLAHREPGSFEGDLATSQSCRFSLSEPETNPERED